MPVTTKVPVGANTVNRKWCIDVNTGTTETPTWTGVFGIQEFKPIGTAGFQDSSDFDGEGWKSQTSTSLEWGAEFKVRRGVTAALATAYDPGQEVLRLAAVQTGLDNTVQVRLYEDNGAEGPKVEAYSGFVGVSYEDEGGGMDALSTASIKLMGQGKRTSITHPGAGV